MTEFTELINALIAAKDDSKTIESLLKPIYDDHCRLQHLDDVSNDILPFDDGDTDCPKVNAEWLLRTPNGLSDDSDLRSLIDDDMKYWAEVWAEDTSKAA